MGRGDAYSGGGSGDWVDESALRAAMARAYETFALMHGTVSAALQAPTAAAVLPRVPTGGETGDGDGGRDDDGTVPGFEVLRRLASARKRLRKAKERADEVRVEKGGVG